MQMDKWQRLDSDTALDTPYFRIRRDVCKLPDGRTIDDYYVYEADDIALVVPITQDDTFVLVQQYKHGISEVCLEIPGGFCEPDTDDPLIDAQRELREETGYTSDSWHKLTALITDPTRSNNRVHIYLALDATRTADQSLDPNEDIRVSQIPKSEIRSAIFSGKINVTDSVAGILLALDWLAQRNTMP